MQLKATESLSFVISLYKAMQKDNLGYLYRGRFTQEITDNILTLTENQLEIEEQSPKIKKRVYSILVECLQNITRHQDDVDDTGNQSVGLFVIQKQDERYYITTGNMVFSANIDYIKKLIDTINGLEKEELKEYYKTVLEDGTLSSKGGAGLGLIDMAKKSGNKLLYQFSQIDNEKSYFYLHTVPSLEYIKDLNIYKEDALNNIIDIHKTLNKEDVLLVSNGPFNQDSLNVLLNSLEGQMSGSASYKKKVIYIALEMIQNIVKHGYSLELNCQGNPGVFIIGESEIGYTLTTGNFVDKAKTKEFEQKISSVNSLSQDKLEEHFNKCLFDFEFNSSKKAGLGIIDLRIKSGNLVKYHINPFNETTDFFALQTIITYD